MIRRLFKYQGESFSEYFFNQRQRYLFPLVDRIFQIVNADDQSQKVKEKQNEKDKVNEKQKENTNTSASENQNKANNDNK